jgi:hypothetical protein
MNLASIDFPEDGLFGAKLHMTILIKLLDFSYFTFL